MSDHNTSPTEQSPETFKTARERDAYATIRGFFFQVERTVQRWLQLGEGQSLELECGEDIDIVSHALVNGEWYEERVLEQLKSWEKSITLINSRESLANFHEHRSQNRGLNLRFCLTTNARVGIERSPLFKDDRRAGIDWWRALAGHQLGEMQAVAVLARIRQKLLACNTPENFNTATWERFREFAGTGDEDAWLDFVACFEWMTGTTSPLDFSQEIQNELLEQGVVADDAAARISYERLFVFVLRILSSEGRKILQASSWKDVVRDVISNEDQALLSHAFDLLDEVKKQIAALDERLSQVENQVDGLTTGQSHLDMRITHIEGQYQGIQAAQTALQNTLETGQDLTSGQLAEIKSQLEEMSRIHPAEEILNSPQAQVWKVEIQIEEARKLLEEGKFRTGQKRLEELKTFVLALPEEHARRQESRLYSLIAFCYWRLDNMQAANDFYGQAFALQPSNAKAAANAAFGALLINEPEEALRLGKKALSLDATNDDALSMVVRALYLLKRADEIESLLQEHPVAAQGLQTLFTRGGVAIALGEYAFAQTLAVDVRDMAPQNPLSHRLYCDAFFIPIQEQVIADAPILLRLLPEQRTSLEKAELAATRALKLMEEWETQTPKIEAYMARAGIRELLGDIEGALEDCDAMLAEDPDNEAAHFMKGEMLLHFRSELKDAFFELRQVKSGRWMEDARVLEAEGLVRLRDWDKVIKVLEPLYVPDASHREQIDLARLLMQAAYFGKKDELVEKLQQDIENHYPDKPAALVTLADLARWQGKIPLALDLLQRAYERASTHGKGRIIFWIAYTRAISGDFPGAAQSLELIVDVTTPDMVLHIYLDYLVRARQSEKAAQIAHELRNGGRAIIGVSEYEADVASSRGDDDLAIQIFEQLSEDDPQNDFYARNTASLLLHPYSSQGTSAASQSELERTARIERARAALERISLKEVKDAGLMMDTAFLRLSAGLPDALRWAYRALRLAPGNGDIGAAYIRFVTFMEDQGPPIDMQVVGAECAVEICPAQDDKTVTSQIWIITDEPLGGDFEIQTNHPLAQKLWGKHLGDSVRLESSSLFGSKEWQIISIQSKYSYALGETVRLFSSGILAYPGMVVRHTTTPEEVAKQERERMRQMLDEGQSLEAIYSDYAVPVAMLAQLTGRLGPDLWRYEHEHGGYAVGEGGRFRTADGSDSETLQHRQVAFSTWGLVLDWTALLTVLYLDIEDALKANYTRIVIPRPLAEEVKTYASHYGSVIAPLNEDIGAMSRREFIGRLAQFALEKCEIVEVKDWNESDEEIAKTYGRSTIAAICVSQQEELPLWSDDLRTRSIAHDRYNGLASVGCQWLLLALQAHRHTSEDNYYEKVRKLVYAGYGFVWVTIPFVLWLFRKNNMYVTEDVRRLLSVLSYWQFIDSIAVPLIAGVLIALWKESLLEHRRRALVGALLDALVAERSTFQVIQALQEQLSELLNLDFLTLHSIIMTIEDWGKRRIQIVKAQSIIQSKSKIIGNA